MFSRSFSLRRLLIAAVILVGLRMFLGILYEYRFYFPPDYERSAFLSGRRYNFVTTYQVAFYVHLASGPLTLVLASVSWFTAHRKKSSITLAIHRYVGRLQMAIVLGLMLPSGLVMSTEAYGGVISRAGFLSLTLATATTAGIGWWHARNRRFASHRIWMTRCAILLFSPLLLRVIAGTCILMQWESVWTYRANAWASWTVPWLVWECFQHFRINRQPKTQISERTG
jgi:hypothetical protein